MVRRRVCREINTDIKINTDIYLIVNANIKIDIKLKITINIFQIDVGCRVRRGSRVLAPPSSRWSPWRCLARLWPVW